MRINLAIHSASLLSVLTRAADGRSIFEGANTWHCMPAAINARANPNPVGPASYPTTTRPGKALAQLTISSVLDEIRSVLISPESSSTVHAHTDRA